MMTSVGILGLGTYLPATVRTNDWWPATTVADWQGRMAHRVTRGDAPAPEAMPEGVRRTLAAMTEIANDPFRGSRERRVMDGGTMVHDMEVAAAREAMTRAGVRPDQIDAILVQTPVAEQLFVNGACITHKLLELPRHCLALSTQGACNAFAQHLTIARGLIASGQARHVLSVHSSAMTRVMQPSEPDSAWWGDGAAAVVIGPVTEGKGVLAAIHNADGSSCDALVLGVEGKRWWEDGAITLHSVNRDHTRQMLMSLLDRARDTVHQCVAKAGITTANVDFYAAHQGTAWLPTATASHAGLGHAKTITSFPMTGNLNSANIPLVLAMAEREGILRDGSHVVTFAGGLGETWSSVALRWGR
jgi:3-oxoacyl-[acyl-carrier-protein] synthase-3